MRWIFIAPLLALLSLGSCIQIDMLLEVYAHNQWEGRPVEEAAVFLGTLQNMGRITGSSQVVIQ